MGGSCGRSGWIRPLSPAPPSTPAYDGKAVYLADFYGEYVSLNATDGSVRWRTPTATSGCGFAPAYANGFVYGACWSGPLLTFDAHDGSIVDRRPIFEDGSTSWPA